MKLYRSSYLGLVAGLGLYAISTLTLAEELNCSNMVRAVPDLEISYREGERYIEYNVSYETSGGYWLGTVFEFRPPFSDNAILSGVGASRPYDLTKRVAENYKVLLLESGAHDEFTESKEMQSSGIDIVGYGAKGRGAINIYGFHSKMSGPNVRVFRLAGVKDESGAAPTFPQVYDAVVGLVAGCENDAT